MVDIYQLTTDAILQAMGRGDLPPWRRSWAPPQNLSGRPYRGINVLLLAGGASPYWVTYRQAKAAGGYVRRGESGSKIVFWKPLNKGKDEGKDEGEGEGEGDRRVVARVYTVFNLSQCEGLVAPPAAESDPLPERTRCEAVYRGYPLPRPSVQGGRPAYNPMTDTVTIPDREHFAPESEYWSTFFHELAHSTGHSSRLRRDIQTVMLGDTYAAEELVAEFAAAFLCARTGIQPAVLENQAAYIAGWTRALKNDKRLLILAASRAQRAVDYILGEGGQ